MSKKLKVIKTPAVLYSKGVGQAFEKFDGDVIKEVFHETDYKKSTLTANIGYEIPGLQSVETNEVIKIGEQDVHSLAFEDGSIYIVGKGLLPETYLDIVDEARIKIGEEEKEAAKSED